jgi:hypothetical protein
MRLLFGLLFVFLCFNRVDAQFTVTPADTAQAQVHKYAVKWVASQFIGRFSSYMLAFEHRLSPWVSLQHTVGVLNNDQGDIQDGYFEHKRGTKLSTQLRLYSLNTSETKDIFIGFEPFMNNYRYNRTRVFELSCGLAGCSYFQEANYDLKEKLRGGRVRVGFTSEISERMFLEMDFALGYAQHIIEPIGKPQNVIRTQDTFQFQDDLFEEIGTYDFAIRLAYIIK